MPKKSYIFGICTKDCFNYQNHAHSSFFGARATGKTELIKSTFSDKEAVFIDLLDPELTNQLSAYPNQLLQLITPQHKKKTWVVIDEVQKVPALLDLVHQQISKKKIQICSNRFKRQKTKTRLRKLTRRACFFNASFPTNTS